MSRRKKIIHYVQLRTYRENSNYSSYLKIFHSKIQPIAWNIDRRLNEKWKEIRRREFLQELHEISPKEKIRTIEEDNQFNEKVFIRSVQLIDELLDLHQQIENNLRENYQYRFHSLRYEFEQEKQSLTNLLHFDHQIDVLNGMEQEEILRQTIQFQLTHRQLQEEFFKDMTQLHSEYQTRIISLKSTMNEIIHSHDNRIVRQLMEKIHRDQQRIAYERKSIRIVKRKIHEQENHLQQLDEKIIEKFQHHSPSHRKSSVDHFRRLSVLTHRIENQCREKLIKIERIFLLIHQCERYEFDEEKLIAKEWKMNFNAMISRINYLETCRYQFDLTFDELTSFWKRFAYVQMDISIRMKEKHSQKKLQNFLQKQLQGLF